MSSASCSQQLSPLPPVASRRSPTAAAADDLLQSTASAATTGHVPWSTAAAAAGLRRRLLPPVPAAGRCRRSPSAVYSFRRRRGRQLSLSADVSCIGQPLLPPLVSRTVDSPCCHCLLVLFLMNSFRCHSQWCLVEFSLGCRRQNSRTMISRDVDRSCCHCRWSGSYWLRPTL
jgi:hypothetical protein